MIPTGALGAGRGEEKDVGSVMNSVSRFTSRSEVVLAPNMSRKLCAREVLPPFFVPASGEVGLVYVTTRFFSASVRYFSFRREYHLNRKKRRTNPRIPPTIPPTIGPHFFAPDTSSSSFSCASVSDGVAVGTTVPLGPAGLPISAVAVGGGGSDLDRVVVPDVSAAEAN